MKKFLYKHAKVIFWAFVVIDVVGFFNEKNILNLFNAVVLIAAYFFFQKKIKDYWFNVYFFSSAASGVIYFLHLYIVYYNNLPRGLISSVIFSICTYANYWYFQRTHNKLLAWMLYIATIIITIFVTNLFSNLYK